MAENETVPDILREMRTCVTGWSAGYIDRLERAWEQEQTSQAIREHMSETCGDKLPVTPEQVRANLGLLPEWCRASELAAWVRILVQFCTGSPDGAYSTDFEYEIFRQQRPAPQWVPKEGDQVKWYGYGCHGTAYYKWREGDQHNVRVAQRDFYVELVEPLTKEDAE